LKIPEGQSKAVNRRKKTKQWAKEGRKKRQTTIYKHYTKKQRSNNINPTKTKTMGCQIMFLFCCSTDKITNPVDFNNIPGERVRQWHLQHLSNYSNVIGICIIIEFRNY
jgi:hypothetical protein